MAGVACTFLSPFFGRWVWACEDQRHWNIDKLSLPALVDLVCTTTNGNNHQSSRSNQEQDDPETDEPKILSQNHSFKPFWGIPLEIRNSGLGKVLPSRAQASKLNVLLYLIICLALWFCWCLNVGNLSFQLKNVFQLASLSVNFLIRENLTSPQLLKPTEGGNNWIQVLGRSRFLRNKTVHHVRRNC